MKASSLVFVLLGGALFGYGLSLSTMIQPEVVRSFLRFQDLGLLFVLGGGALVTLVTYQLAPRLMKKPLVEPAFGKHPSELTKRTIFGAAIFGVGWGISSVCPGPAIAGIGAGNWPILIAFAGMAAGAYVQGRWFST
jgi:uncharacterized membrane protein YedE/YeeE